MKLFKGYSAERSYGEERIPAGNYIGEIKNAKVEQTQYGDFLVIAFDITEGEFAGYFQEKYDRATGDSKKWRGTCRVRIPDEKSQYYESEKRSFENMMFAIEDSNRGFHFDSEGTEAQLKGKTAGFLSRDKEFKNVFGEVITFTEFVSFASANDVRDGKVKPLKAKLLKPEEKPTETEYSDFTPIPTDDDIPF